MQPSRAWDYKPELVNRHGQPVPGAESPHLPGANRNLTKSPYAFKPRGRCGKYLSDLLPNLADLADDMCFIHSMTAKANTHGPAESQMNTGFTQEGFPSMARAATPSARKITTCRRSWPSPTRGVPQMGPANWSNGFLPAVFQGTAFSADRPIPNLKPPPQVGSDADATSDFLKVSTTNTSSAPRRHRIERPSPPRAGGADAAERPGSQRPVARAQGRE